MEIRGLDDKCETTVLSMTTLSGTVLPPQLIYAGKTPRCHPTGVSFPSNSNVTHSNNSNEQKPCLNSNKAALSLSSDVHAIALFYVFTTHRYSSVLSRLQDANIKTCFIPADCIGLLQPLDIRISQLLFRSNVN